MAVLLHTEVSMIHYHYYTNKGVCVHMMIIMIIFNGALVESKNIDQGMCSQHWTKPLHTEYN